MVDLVDIGFSIDSSQIKTAKQELAELGNSFNSATKSASVFEQAFARAAAQSAKDAAFLRDRVRANQDLINTNLGVTNSYKSAEQSASAFGVVLNNIDRASKAFAANFNGVVGITGGRATSNGAGFGAIEGEIERLRLKYDQIYSSSQLYEKSLAELNRAHMLGVTSVKQHEAALESLNMEYQNFQSGVAQAGNRFAQYAAQSATGMNKFGVAAQQTGYQVSDFLVQVQSGTNPLVAFSQQATQLAGLMYLLPPAALAARVGLLGFSVSLATATAGLTIVIPLLAMLAMSFFSSSKDAKKGADEVDLYTDTIKGLTEEIEKNQQAFLNAKFGTDNPNIANAKDQIIDLESRIVSLSASIERTREIGGRAAAYASQVSGPEKLEADKKALEDQLALLIHQENVKIGIAAAEEASRIQNLYKLQLIDDQVEKDNAVHDALLAVQNANYKYIESQKISIGLLIQQYSLYGQIATTAEAIATASQNTQYYKLGTLNEGMMGRAGAKGQGEAVSYSFVEPDKVKKAGATKKDPLVELQKQIALQEELNGKTEAERQVRQALGDDYSKYSPTIIKGLEDQIQKQIELEDRLKEQQGLYDTIQSSMESAFMSMVDGTKSAKDAFKSMAAAIIKELYNVLVVQQLVGSFNASTGAGSGIVGAIAGGLAGGFGGGSGYVKSMAGRANGGPISAGVPYMVGERGPEMIIPKSAGTVLTNGQTKAALGGESYVVNNNITVTGSDSAMVRQEIAKMIPQISSATKAAMIDAKRRGGQMGNAFR